MTSKFLSMLAGCLLFFGTEASAQYTGRVVVDVNSNGMYDHDDQGLAGVAVSDGCNVVRTAADGGFTLPGYARARFVTITTPAGYRAVNYYIPVCDSIPSYHFLLTPNPDSADAGHRFVQITDTEIFNRGVDDRWCGYLRSYVAAERPAFLIHTGDICYESGLRQHIRSVNEVSMGCPVYYALGNHDLVAGDYGEQLFERIYGPSWYSFDAGNVHYVVTPMAYGDHEPGFTAEEVLRWLKNDLRMMTPGQVLVVFNHDSPATDSEFVFRAGDQCVDLKEHNLRAWVYGHTHYNHCFEMSGVAVICTSSLDKGGIDHSVSAFRRFDMTGLGIGTHRLKYTYLEPTAVIALPAVGQQPVLTADGKVCISINAYYSGAETKRVSVVLKSATGRCKTVASELVPRGEWNWYAEIAPPVSGQQIEAQATAYFSDGTTALSSVRFDPGRGVPLVIRTGSPWQSLGGSASHYLQPDSCLREPAAGRIVWSSNVGSVFMASPVIADGRVYVASCNESGTGESAVYALDARSGEKQWCCPTRAGIKNSIAYDSGYIAAQDARGYLYVMDAVSGSLKWKKQLIDGDYPYLSEGLVANDGVVYAGNGNSLCAYRLDSGELLWRNRDRTGGVASSTTLTLCHGVLISSGQWSGLYGYDAATGKLLWTCNSDGLRDRSGSAVCKDGLVFLTSGRSLFGLDPVTGEIVSRKQYDDFQLDAASCPLFTGEEVIFGTSTKGLLAVDARTHDVRWNLTTGTSLVFSAPYTTLPSAAVESSAVLKGGVVWFGASDGCLYGVSPSTGAGLWKFRSGAPFLSSPAVSGNLLVAADFGGNVYGICVE